MVPERKKEAYKRKKKHFQFHNALDEKFNVLCSRLPRFLFSFFFGGNGIE